MKSIKEIAGRVKDPASMWGNKRVISKTPPGVAQQIILDALGIQANNFSHANAIFEAIGIGVGHKRVGRSSVPVVSKLDRSGGGFNLDGEGEAWDDWSPDVDLSAIREWMGTE